MNKLLIWIQTEDGFMGPFPSRRVAGKVKYGVKKVARTRKWAELAYYISLSNTKEVVAKTPEEVNDIEELMYIDNRMLANAY